MDDPVETSEMVAFTKAVESKSLSRAAAELGVPRATLSRRLARLEERLGVRLLRRTTRSLTLTDAGEAFHRHARIALDAVAQAEQSVRRTDDVIRGPLRVSAPPMIDPTFHAMLCEFAARYPAVSLQVSFTTQLVDLQRDGYDVALRASARLEPGLVARTLARTEGIAVASPAYLAEKGTPRTRRDLAHHRCLLGFARGELPETHWPLEGGGRLRVEGSLFSNDLTFLREAALRGLGIAVLPSILVQPQLQSGELVHVLAGVIRGDARVSIVYAERELVPPQVRAFIDAVVAWVPRRLQEAASGGRPAPVSPPRPPAGKGAVARPRSSPAGKGAVARPKKKRL